MRATKKRSKFKVDLNGPGGSLEYLRRFAHVIATNNGMDRGQVAIYLATDDREAFIAAFERIFGEYVTLVR